VCQCVFLLLNGLHTSIVKRCTLWGTNIHYRYNTLWIEGSFISLMYIHGWETICQSVGAHVNFDRCSSGAHSDVLSWSVFNISLINPDLRNWPFWFHSHLSEHQVICQSTNIIFVVSFLKLTTFLVNDTWFILIQWYFVHFACRQHILCLFWVLVRLFSDFFKGKLLVLHIVLWLRNI
jgi:hypothetical protein